MAAKEEKPKSDDDLFTTFLDHDNLPQFKCVQCGVTYIKRCMMKKHVVIHSTQREKFKCDECGQLFNRMATVKEHQQRKHKKIERYSCFVCQKGFYERTCMLKHLNVHDDAIEKNPGKPLGFLPKKLLTKIVEKGVVEFEGRQVSCGTVCMQCYKILSSTQTLKRHRCPLLKAEESIKAETLLEGNVKSEKSISCILDCSKVFQDLAEFDLHMSVGDHDGLFFFTCSGCEKKFASTKAMKGHVCQQDVEINPPEISGNVPTVGNARPIEEKNEDLGEGGEASIAVEDIAKEKELVANEENVGKENLTLVGTDTDFDGNYQRIELSELNSLSCNECGQSFSAVATLEFHLRVHRIEKIQHCRSTGCGLTFASQELFLQHKLAQHGIQSKETGSRYVKEKCQLCELSFNKYDIKKHMLRHNGEKNFTCAECGKKLKRQESLKLHMMLHTGIKNYKCDQCGHNFYTIQSLQNHRNNKHNSDNINMCAECGKECPNKYDLRWHMAKHTGEKSFACREEGCDKRFRISHMRSNHEKIHRGQKDFHCTQCEKKFIQRTSLVTHLKRHNGIKEHKCVTCGKAFVEPAGARNCQHSKQISSRSIGPGWPVG